MLCYARPLLTPRARSLCSQLEEPHSRSLQRKVLGSWDSHRPSRRWTTHMQERRCQWQVARVARTGSPVSPVSPVPGRQCRQYHVARVASVASVSSVAIVARVASARSPGSPGSPVLGRQVAKLPGRQVASGSKQCQNASASSANQAFQCALTPEC